MVVLLVLALVFLSSCSNSKDIEDSYKNEKIKIGVSIVPEEAFIKAVGGEKVSLVTMIPPGTSPANYGPTPKEMAQLENADLYFAIGVNAEIENILPNIEENSSTKIIHLSKEIESIYPSRFFGEISEEHGEEEAEEDHDHSGRDPHIWMSPKRVIEIIRVIEKELSFVDPENQGFYKENMDKYIEELEDLDSYIRTAALESKNKTFIVYHPSLGYFADDYGLEMVSIESDGKEGTIENLKSVIDFSKDRGIKRVLYQSEFDSKQAEILAGEIDGEAIMIEPLSKDYINNLKQISEVILNVGY